MASWASWEAQRKGLVDLGSCQDKSREIRKLRMQDRASERLQDPIIEEIKEIGKHKDRRSLADSGERA